MCAVTLGAHTYRTSKRVQDKGYHTKSQQESEDILASTTTCSPLKCPCCAPSEGGLPDTSRQATCLARASQPNAAILVLTSPPPLSALKLRQGWGCECTVLLASLDHGWDLPQSAMCTWVPIKACPSGATMKSWRHRSWKVERWETAAVCRSRRPTHPAELLCSFNKQEARIDVLISLVSHVFCIHVSSIYWTVYNFFASQSQRKHKIIIFFFRRSKRQRKF